MPSRLGNVPSCKHTRARAESLGGKLKGVGIGERAERLLIIAIIGMIPMREAMQWAMIIVSIVGITLGSEVVVTVRRLSSTEKLSRSASICL